MTEAERATGMIEGTEGKVLLYATPRPRARRLPPLLALVAGVAAVVCFSGCIWCGISVRRMAIEEEQLAGARPIDLVPSIPWLSFGQVVPLGVLSGGMALAMVIVSIRVRNSARLQREMDARLQETVI